jgi:hypothetical protein
MVGVIHKGKLHMPVEGKVEISKSSISMQMLFRYLIKMKAKCDKDRLKIVFTEMLRMSHRAFEYEKVGILTETAWVNTSGKKSDRYNLPILICPKKFVSRHPEIMEIKVPEFDEGPDFIAYSKEIAESATQFFYENLIDEMHNALDNLLWESQLSAMKKAARSLGLPDSIPQNVVKRVKKHRLNLFKERFNIRRGRSRNSLTRSPEALLRRHRRVLEQREIHKAKLLEAAISILRVQANGESSSELNKSNLALKLGKSRQTIHNWMTKCKYSLVELEEEANQFLRREVNN